MFQLIDVFFAFITIALMVLVGRFVRQRIKILRDLYLPSSIVAGAIALLLGPQALGAVIAAIAGSTLSPLAQGLFPENIRNVWSQSPSVFINVVFATLFIGESIPSPRDIWRKASPQVAFGQTLAWGQYVVGLLLAIFILTPVFGMSPIAGSLIEVAFEGGHGTAAGMAETFNNLGFTVGPDLALGLATVGIVSGIVAGTMLADWARRSGKIQVIRSEDPNAGSFSHDRTNEDPTIRVARARLMRDLLIDPLSLNLSFVGLAIAIGWLILQALIYIESITWGRAGIELFSYVPLFPIALIGGLIVQLLLERTGRSYLISRPLIERIGGVALDVTIVTALASISLAVLGSNLGPFLILSVAGIAWNVLAFIYLGPRILPTFWFERGIGDMGQSMGVTATGLVLMRMVDPDNRSGAFESFAYKQLLFEPIVGGGLFTAAAPLLIAQFGPVMVLLLTTVILIFWLVFGIYNFKRITKTSQVV